MIFQFDLTGSSAETTNLDFELWLSHDSVLDKAKDFDVSYSPAHNALSGTFIGATNNQLLLHSSETGGTAVVRTLLYICITMNVT